MKFEISAALLVLTCGCVGYKSVLFSTKSNVGLDADTKPPTLEVSISRREGVVGPSFEDGKMPPVVGSFQITTNSFPLFPRMKTTFAGGSAATVITHLFD